MKQQLLTMALALTLAWGAGEAGATTPKNDSVNIVADTTQNDELEAFSDTTSTSGAVASPWDNWPDDEENWETASIDSIFDGFDFGTLSGMFFALSVLLIIFVLAPIALIGIILYFAYKSRKQRMRLAEMAMQSGQQIPTDVMGGPVLTNDALWNKGIRQVFLGAGLAFLLWIPIGKLGLAIGCLILLMGCGNLVIAHKTRQKMEEKEMYERMFGGNGGGVNKE
jgi:hypothetical protein